MTRIEIQESNAARVRLIWWVLRIGAAMCFIGHGAFGVIGKAEWLPFFAQVGIGGDMAWRLMPLIGVVDILLGLSVLVAPRRIVLVYMAAWAVWTAALRPMTGDTVFELLERAGNYGVPIAMLLLLGRARSWREWLSPVATPAPSESDARRGTVALGWTAALLLFGHGALAAIAREPLYVEHAAALGLGPGSAVAAGWLEIALALLVLAHPRPLLLVAVAGWKLGTELLFPLAGAPVWEFIERGGSYAAPLALAVLVTVRRPAAFGMAAASFRTGEASGAGGIVRVAALVMLAAATVVRPAIAQQPPDSGERERAAASRSVLALLQEGGYVIVLRHTATDHSAGDRGSAREQQRNLTAEGERQARAIGEAIRHHGIPIGDVRANPMYRNRETAELAFGRMIVEQRLGGQRSSEYVRATMSEPVPEPRNLVLVTRIGVITSAFEGLGVPRIDEGDAIVVRPLGEGRCEVVAVVRVGQWMEIGSMRPR
ncbi:MAG TPA: histidine phosphatase family protein [Gemmatimonadaceae bacterium]|nr:histidine phosphatase family protein [Gemmatimonadaceae bacterium]